MKNGKKEDSFSYLVREDRQNLNLVRCVQAHEQTRKMEDTPVLVCTIVKTGANLSLSLSFTLDSHIFNTVLTKSKAKSHISTTSTTATSLKDLRFDGGVGGRDRSRITHLVLCASRSPSSFLVHGGNSRTLKTTCFACGLSDPSSPHPVIILRFWYQLIIVLKKINK